jgi:alkaline phosphatase D
MYLVRHLLPAALAAPLLVGCSSGPGARPDAAGAAIAGAAGAAGAPAPGADTRADDGATTTDATPSNATSPTDAPSGDARPRDATTPFDAAPSDARPSLDVAAVDGGSAIQRIAFGSCNDLTRPQTFWPHIIEHAPQAFLFLGDNAYLDYGDTYAELGAVPGFQQLLAIAQPIAIWDDHDFGLNDGGAAFVNKDSFKKKFLDFWGPLGAVPADSPRRTRPGLYDVAALGPPGRRVQLVMLDNRYFKGLPPSGTVLGDAQWQWLAATLASPSDLRVIMSGIQAVGSSTESEGWAEFPDEQQHLYDVIKASGAKGVLIVSGDKHYAEISRRDVGLGYPLYDFTSSSLTASNSYAPQENIYRDTPTSASQNHNFGLLTIDWASPGVPVSVQIFDAGTGAVLLAKDLSLALLGAR